MGICDVCDLVDGDRSAKLVNHCAACDAWICEGCAPDMVRRAKAMMVRGKRALMRGLKGDSGNGCGCGKRA